MKKLLFFYRQSQHANQLAPLDGLRALSILFVIIFHAFFLSQYGFENLVQFGEFSAAIPWYLQWIKRGDLGVDIFFVLSAFLIGSQLFKEKNQQQTINYRRFYLKRFLRIYPIYGFALLLVLLAKGWDWNLLGNLLAFNNLFNLKEIIIPWSWSLSVEIQFYLIAPLAILLIFNTRYKSVLAIVILVLSLTWNSFFYFNSADLQSNSILDLLINDNESATLYYLQTLYVVPPARVGSFVVGLAAAFFWVFHQTALFNFYVAQKTKLNALLAIVLISLILMASVDLYVTKESLSTVGNLLYTFTFIAGRLFFSIGIACLILLCLASSPTPNLVHRILSHPVLYPIARGSYSMYLFHPYFLFLGYYLLFGESKITSLSVFELLSLGFLGTFFSFIFSVFTYYAIEKWFHVKQSHERV